MTQTPPGPPPPARPWRAALSLFTVIPAGAPAELDAAAMGRAMFWLPAVGLLLGLIAAGGMAAVQAGGPSVLRQLLGAAVAIALLTVLTGGLHLDGLADTADGLGSRRPAADALAIMRRPDIGPLGVVALVLVLLIQVTALAAVPRGWPAVAALVLAAVTGRVAAVLATGLPPARPGGLGALVAGRTGRAGRVMTGLVLLAAVIPAGLALGGAPGALRGLVAALAGLLTGGLVARGARRQLGGMTGDVFGAIIELSTAIVLLALALSLWARPCTNYGLVIPGVASAGQVGHNACDDYSGCLPERKTAYVHPPDGYGYRSGPGPGGPGRDRELSSGQQPGGGLPARHRAVSYAPQ